MRHGQVEGRLAQLDGEDEEHAQEHEPDGANDRVVELEHLGHVEGARGLEEGHGHEQHHGLVAHHLQRLAGRADLGVGAARGIGGHDEEQARQRDDEHAQKQVAAGVEDAAGDEREQQRAGHVDAFHGVDGDALLLEELAHVVVGLQKRRPHAALHAGRDDAVETGQEAPDDGACHGEQEGADECRKQSHEITPFLKAHRARDDGDDERGGHDERVERHADRRDAGLAEH